MNNFDKDLYRKFNQDLAFLDDNELRSHFLSNQHEARLYGATKGIVESFSMRWLRGSGLEIGAGKSPTPFFGNTVITYCDIDPDHNFGAAASDVISSVDSDNFKEAINQEFDFVICSHVLEHVDSFIRAIENLLSVIKKNGIVYLVLPDIDYLHDKNWLPYFDFEHHILEYHNPMAYSKLHDELYINTVIDYIDNSQNDHAILTVAYRDSIKQRLIPDNMRFMHHKHNYNLEGWVKLLIAVQTFLESKFSILDIGYGHQRKDIHFILQSLR